MGLCRGALRIFLYRQFFSSFPKELEEAAVIDGAGRIRVFFQIFLPLSRPLMVTAFVLAFNAVWGDFIAPNLLLDQSNTTLAVGCRAGYVNEQGFLFPNILALRHRALPHPGHPALPRRPALLRPRLRQLRPQIREMCT